MKDKAWRLSPVLFAIAAIFFFMPFMDASSADKKVLAFTGIEMVTGAAIEPAELQEAMKNIFPGGRTGAQPFAVATLALIVLGGLAGFVRQKSVSAVSAVCAGIGTVTLLMLKSKIDANVFSGGGGLFKISFSYGFWVILFCLALSIALNAWIFSGQHDEHHTFGGFDPRQETDPEEDW